MKQWKQLFTTRCKTLPPKQLWHFKVICFMQDVVLEQAEPSAQTLLQGLFCILMFPDHLDSWRPITPIRWCKLMHTLSFNFVITYKKHFVCPWSSFPLPFPLASVGSEGAQHALLAKPSLWRQSRHQDRSRFSSSQDDYNTFLINPCNPASKDYFSSCFCATPFPWAFPPHLCLCHLLLCHRDAVDFQVLQAAL